MMSWQCNCTWFLFPISMKTSRQLCHDYVNATKPAVDFFAAAKNVNHTDIIELDHYSSAQCTYY